MWLMPWRKGNWHLTMFTETFYTNIPPPPPPKINYVCVRSRDSVQSEIVSELVYSFLIPNVEKKLVRGLWSHMGSLVLIFKNLLNSQYDSLPPVWLWCFSASPPEGAGMSAGSSEHHSGDHSSCWEPSWAYFRYTLFCSKKPWSRPGGDSEMTSVTNWIFLSPLSVYLDAADYICETNSFE